MDYLNINRKLWNDKTSVHYQSDFYDVKSFIKGKDSLNPIEIEPVKVYYICNATSEWTAFPWPGEVAWLPGLIYPINLSNRRRI
jgi:hypothetical protein